MPIVEWDGKTLKEYKGELDDDQHQRKQKGLSAWQDLLGGDCSSHRPGAAFIALGPCLSKAGKNNLER